MGTVSILLYNLIRFYIGLICVWCILSWVPKQQESFIGDLYEVLGRLVWPYLSFFRSFIPAVGGIDFSPILAIMLLEVIQRLLLSM